MNSIRRKLRSQKGASITFALLLFLVCAVLSGVIIVAASTASGRMDQIAESDQRYYAVTSAAELLKDVLDGKTVTVKTVETSTEIVPHNYTLGTPVTPTVTKETIMWYDEAHPITMNAAFAASPPSVLADAAYRVAEKQYQNGVSTKHLIDPPEGTTGPIVPSTAGIKLSLQAAETTIKSAISANMYADIQNNGIIYFYVSKGDDANKAYTLRLSFKADVKTTVDENTSVGAPMNVVNDAGVLKYDTEEETVKTTETTMTWSMTDIVKAVMPVSTGTE